MFAIIVRRLSDAAKARIRTFWPYLVGVIATWLVAKIRPIGVHLDSVTAAAIVSWVLGSLVYEIGKWLAGRKGTRPAPRLARWAGQWLVSVGLPIQQPTYPDPPAKPAATAPAPAPAPAPTP
jgi:hypothetical protein